MDILEKIKKIIISKRFLRFELLALVILIIVAGVLYFSDVPPVMAQSTAAALPDATMPQNGQRVLVFSPHPDDETIGVGGFIAQSIENGADVRIVLVTNGDFHGDEQVRYDEFKKATQILGVPESQLVFLGYPDGKLDKMNAATLSTALQTQITQYNPDIVIYPDTQDANPDHSTIGKTVEQLLKAEPDITGYEYLVHYKLIWPRPRALEPKLELTPPYQLLNKNTSWERVPLSQTNENLKSEAIHTYKSQLANSWLNGLLISSIRRNELLAVPQNNGSP